MNSYQYRNFTIEVLDEADRNVDLTNNNLIYSKQFLGNGAEFLPSSKHGIRIYEDNQVVDSCLLYGFGGATSIHLNSSLLDNDQLLVICSDTVFCLTLPILTLKWKIQADPFTCFQIFKHNNDYIVHGELQVAMLDNMGQIKWEFGGADIFVSPNNE